jgi:hypothetical protein
MKKGLKKKWVAALRSGKYEQGREYLQADGKFCCLGVLCEVAKVPSVDLSGEREYRFVKPSGGVDERTGELAECFREAHGISASAEGKLIDFNDGRTGTGARSFKWIASYIERYL